MTLEQIAIDIADESEAVTLEWFCPVTVYDGLPWRDTRAKHVVNPTMVARAVAYLTRRNLLQFCTDHPHLVRIPRQSELGLQATAFLCP